MLPTRLRDVRWCRERAGEVIATGEKGFTEQVREQRDGAHRGREEERSATAHARPGFTFHCFCVART